MTQEEKAKAYDEAIERSKNYYSTTDSADDIKLIGLIFPELKESEGERMVKFIKKQLFNIKKTITENYELDAKLTKAIDWLEKQGNLMKALQISNARIGELIEENYYLKEQLEKQGKNNMGISEATKQELEDNLNKALEKETPESCNEFLEKQGEQKPVFEMKTPEESLGIDSNTYNKIVDECVYGEQKPIKEHNACEFCEDRYGCVSPCSMKLIEEEKYTDNVEPKFHEGDWVVSPNGVYWHIDKISNNRYEVTSDTGASSNWPLDTNIYRSFSIQDAKDGDVLVSEYPLCGLDTWYCIFKSLDGDESMTVYCYLSRDGRFETKKELCFDKDPYNTKPATKEQRDTLMKAMADAGYTFDFEKKELKNVEQKPAWSEEDEEMLENIICDINTARQYVYVKSKCDEEIVWLKFLKERYTWEPSDEQIEILEHFVRSVGESGYASPYDNNTKLLYSLLSDLKKLKE